MRLDAGYRKKILYIMRDSISTYQRLIRLSKEAEKDGAYRVAKRLRAVVLNSEGRTSTGRTIKVARLVISDARQRNLLEEPCQPRLSILFH
jgi:hypothetical protein